MADNVTAPATGVALATDEISAVHYQRVKVTWGADGTANDASAANPLPVAVTFPATQPVSLASAPLATGAATSAKQDTLIGHVDGLETLATAIQAAAEAARPSTVYVPVTLGSGDLAGGACKAIIAETAGRVNLKQPNGTTRENFPLVAGLNPIGALMINSPTSGTAATGVWALY